MAKDTRQLDLRIEVQTPENIAFQYRVAGPFRRLPAYLIDLVIRGLLAWSALMLFVFSFGSVGLFGLVGGWMLIVWFVLSWFYGGLFEAYWNGQTPGKRMMRLRVLSTDGQPINALQAVLRNILRAADAMPVIPIPGAEMAVPLIPLYQVGLLVPMLNERYQRLGDLACGTMVVVEEREYRAGIVPMRDVDAIRLSAELPPNLRISRSLGRALTRYVSRRAAFSAERRAEIARRLGEVLCRQYDLPSTTYHDRLLCALYFRAFINDRGEAVDQPSERSAPRTPAAARR